MHKGKGEGRKGGRTNRRGFMIGTKCSYDKA